MIYVWSYFANSERMLLSMTLNWFKNRKHVHSPWTQDVKWTYIRRSEEVQDVFCTISLRPMLRGIARTQHFAKSQHFFCPNTHIYVYVYHGVRNVSFSENFGKWLIWSGNYKQTRITCEKFLYKKVYWIQHAFEVERDSL